MPTGQGLIERDQWLKGAREGDPPEAGVRKSLTAEVKQADEDERSVEFVVSTGDPDRDGDIIEPDGWELRNFRKNPVVLWSHSHRALPIAKATEIRSTGNELRAVAQFPEPGIHGFADTVFELLSRGFLKATSVGFDPLEWTINEERGGIDFQRQELLEFSVVPVPANPEALIAASEQGVDMEPVKRWATSTLKALDEDETVLTNGYEASGTNHDTDGSAEDPGTVKVEVDTTGLEKKLDRLLEAIEAAEETPATKDVISYEEAHSGGTPKADRDREWDGGEEVAEADVEDLGVMCAWRAETDEEPDKEDFKLPHHLASGEHAVVWRAITNAAARLPQTDVPEADVEGIQNHIGRHYEEFDETAPWDRDEETWEIYARWASREERSPENIIWALRASGFELEASGLEKTIEAREKDVVDELIELVEEPEPEKEEDPEGPLEELLLMDEEDLRSLTRAAVEEKVTEHKRAVTGRLD